MSRRNKIVLGIVIAVVVILIIIIMFLVFRSPKVDNEDLLTSEEETSQVTINIPEPVAVTPELTIPINIDSETRMKNELSDLAITFAERFGSFSNQSDLKNIYDIQVFMNEEMIEWSDGFIAKEKSNRIEGASYYGISTKAVSTEFEEFNNPTGLAKVLVKTQRTEAQETTTNTYIFYQDILIDFEKDGEEWKVSSVSWQ